MSMPADSGVYIERYQKDYPLWCKEMLGMQCTEDQIRAANELNNFPFVSIRSGTTTGKTTFLSTVGIWFLTTHPESKIPCTAPTGHQLEDLMFAEMQAWIRRIKYDKIREGIKVIQGKIYIEGYRDWYIAARTIPKDSKDKLGDVLAGFHAPHLLFLVDEASGVPDQVFKGLEGSMIQKNCCCVLASNPARSNGFFYDTHNKNRSQWANMVFSSTRSPFVQPQWIERMRDLHGEDSDFFKVKVLGEFPRGGASSLVSIDDLYDAFERHKDLDPNLVNAYKVAGLDPAGGKHDYSVLTIRKGCYIFDPIRIQHSDTFDLVGKTRDLCLRERIEELYVDYTGLGVGVYDQLRRMDGFRTYKVVMSAKANDPQAYRNLRAELYCELSEQFHLLALPAHDRYISEFGEIYKEEDKIPIEIVDKKEIRKRLGFSPDFADSLVVSTYRNFDLNRYDYSSATGGGFIEINENLRRRSSFAKL